MSGNPNSLRPHVIPAGCAFACGSAAITCLMLLINGSFVLAILDSIPNTAPAWVRKPEFLQFMLFLIPVLLVVVQWIVIDYVRGKFRPRDPD